MNLLAAIEARRQALGISVVALAERAGVDRNTVWCWYGKGKQRTRSPRVCTLEPVAEVLGMRLALEPITAEPIRFVRRRSLR